MLYEIEVKEVENGVWCAGVVGLAGAYTYGASREMALRRVQALTLHILATKLVTDAQYQFLDQIEFRVLPSEETSRQRNS